MEPKVPKSEQTVEVTLPDGKVINLPILIPSRGTPMIDIRALYALSGHFTFDPGFTCTGSCASNISYIDGQKGELYHRGYSITEICDQGTYIELCFLLHNGMLPSLKELEIYENMVVSEMMLHKKILNLYTSYKHSAHPMAILVGVVGSLSAFDKFTSSYEMTVEDRHTVATRLVAKMPMIAAAAYRTSRGLPIVQPKQKYGYVENFIRMMFKDPMGKWKDQRNEKMIKIVEKILIIHTDNGQGSSATTVRIAASSNANPYSCIAAGISSHWGPQQGGADECVIQMLEEIGSVDNIPRYLERAKDRNDSFRIMGFGHRVYKCYDPRAKIAKDIVLELAKDPKNQDPILDLALALEEACISDDYFKSRLLFPNVDFFTGLIYRIGGIPREMFTVIFTVARTAGWMSQWLEMMSDPTRKIGRPR